MSQLMAAPRLSEAEILAIAEADAIIAYRDLSHLKREVKLQGGMWSVEYRLNFPPGSRVAGGGPHYVIDATTGEIVSKVYHQ
ncbi:MAG: hypothetical protein U0791_19140 [Gemmataceae bacterium]|jgi:hypothetical protein